jgi:glycosyltransferase involved in cell wall biosynthesis
VTCEAEISVITAAYNSAGVIERNIRSVAAQSLQPKEHIVIDDGSVDDTASIVEALQREFPHLQLIRQANGGAARARNTGIAAATGRFVAFLDSDDTHLVRAKARNPDRVHGPGRRAVQLRRLS